MASNKKPRKKYKPPMSDAQGQALLRRVGGDTGKLTEKDLVINTYQANSLRVINDVRRGSVAELDLDKLQNFIQTMNVVLDLIPLETFREAQRIAELRYLIHHKPEEVIVMDKEKLDAAKRTTSD